MHIIKKNLHTTFPKRVCSSNIGIKEKQWACLCLTAATNAYFANCRPSKDAPRAGDSLPSSTQALCIRAGPSQHAAHGYLHCVNFYGVGDLHNDQNFTKKLQF